MLAGLGINARAGQILLTQSTSQALELVIRYLLKPWRCGAGRRSRLL